MTAFETRVTRDRIAPRSPTDELADVSTSMGRLTVRH